MHLLHGKLHGPAKGSNLVPALGLLNTSFYWAVENPAEKALLPGTNGKPAEDMIWYKVDVSFHSNNKSHHDYGFPKSIGVKWGGYDLRRRKWVEKSSSKGYRRDNLELPEQLGTDTRLNINQRSPTRIMGKFGVSKDFAASLKELRPFRNMRSLKLRMTNLISKLPATDAVSYQQDLKKILANEKAIRFDSK
jgi:hypothetical protein